MQKIAYSTLAIAAPVVLQGCSEEDEQTAPEVPEVDCSTLAEADCKAIENAQCNWDQNPAVDPVCETSQDKQDVVALAGDDRDACGAFGGEAIVSQQCKNTFTCEDTMLNDSRWELGRNISSSILTFDMISEYLDRDGINGLEVKFHACNADFQPVDGNPDNLCEGVFVQNTATNILTLCAASSGAGTCTAGAVFTCNGTIAQPADSIDVVDNPNFSRNIVYDAEFFDACSNATTCGMHITDGDCRPIEQYCEQFDAATCPIESEKTNVSFIQGTYEITTGVFAEIDILNTRTVCEYVTPPNLETGAPAEGCQTISADDFELVTCAASPFPSNGVTSSVPAPDGTDTTVSRDEYCSHWLADAVTWNDETVPIARQIWECSDGSPVLAADGSVSCADSTAPTVSTRACEFDGLADQAGQFSKLCSLPRNWACSVATGATSGDALAGCAIADINLCVYDDGNRDVCERSDGASPPGTEDSGEDVDGVRGPDDDTE